MAFSLLRSTSSSVLNRVRFCQRSFSAKSSSPILAVKGTDREKMMFDSDRETPEYDVPTSGISRPLSEILKELNKKVRDSLIKFRHEPNGFSVKYIPWHIVNRILNFMLRHGLVKFVASLTHLIASLNPWCITYSSDSITYSSALSDPAARAIYDLKKSTMLMPRSRISETEFCLNRRWETDQCW
ncbi:hypothetical protein A4A49_08170 [Nicotiana attenuata]|uniref:Uncharacterized protein n=1 Tax=Nicotiana attenuata TaxID=49451 RepID=A0A314L155_NICAT|nr:hypothetical protein A4A49_08170 [Nicotiana attenuata]